MAWACVVLAGLVVAVTAAGLEGGLQLAYAPAYGLTWALAAWPLAHADWGHLAGNLTVLALVGPQLEARNGPVRVLGVFVAGSVVGLGAHVALHADVALPLVGASAGIYALVAYNLVAGWNCAFESRSGRVLAHPAQLFYALLAFELARWAVSVTTVSGATGAPAHLGGLAAGVVTCGLAERLWPVCRLRR